MRHSLLTKCGDVCYALADCWFLSCVTLYKLDSASHKMELRIVMNSSAKTASVGEIFAYLAFPRIFIHLDLSYHIIIKSRKHVIHGVRKSG